MMASMALSLQKFREIVFQLLYSRGFEESDWEAIVPMVMRQLTMTKKTVRLAKERAEIIWEKRETLDQMIVEKAKNYELNRIPRVEQTVLRLGIFELLYSDLPKEIVIAEALRINRKFATAEGVGFVHAILDTLQKENQHVETAKIAAPE